MPREYRLWTASDEELLRQMAPRHNHRAIAEVLNRTPEAVRARGQLLGVKITMRERRPKL